MKNKVIFILIFIFLIVTGFKNVKTYSFPLLGKLIIIDPGHGGKDPGTMYNDIYEKDLVLKISLYLNNHLNKMGASTMLTRTGDYDLSVPNAFRRKKSDFDNRIKIINENHADLYLSIHLNYLSLSQYYGGQVFYNPSLKANYNLAQNIQNSFNKNLKSDREIKIIPSTNYMYKKLNVPGVLIECGFLSNPNEREKLITDEYQQQIAKTITQGIVNYYN